MSRTNRTVSNVNCPKSGAPQKSAADGHGVLDFLGKPGPLQVQIQAARLFVRLHPSSEDWWYRERAFPGSRTTRV